MEYKTLTLTYKKQVGPFHGEGENCLLYEYNGINVFKEQIIK